MSRAGELIVQSFTDPATRPEALARYLEGELAGAAATPELLEAALAAALASYQSVQADSARQAAEGQEAERHT